MIESSSNINNEINNNEVQQVKNKEDPSVAKTRKSAEKIIMNEKHPRILERPRSTSLPKEIKISLSSEQK